MRISLKENLLTAIAPKTCAMGTGFPQLLHTYKYAVEGNGQMSDLRTEFRMPAYDIQSGISRSAGTVSTCTVENNGRTM